MNRVILVLVAAALMAACGGGSSSVAAKLPPGPVVKYRNMLPGQSSTGSIDLIQTIINFAPGSQTLKHHHGGPGVITVIQGEVTLSSDGVERTYKVGESFTELSGQTLQAFNRGTSELIVVATYLLPDGAQLSTNV